MSALLLAALILLAFANGANDNGKGVATLIGSGVLRERTALGVALVATALGAAAAPLLGAGLFKAFSGHGLVAGALVANPAFPMAVALGGAAAVLIFTALRMPVSTTHALLGGLLGAGAVMAGPRALSFGRLGEAFLLPLVASPLMAALATFFIAPLLGSGRRRGEEPHADARDAACLCVVEAAMATVASPGGRDLYFTTAFPFVATGRRAECANAPGVLWSLEIPAAREALHILSGAGVSFARGLNDTPKMAALLTTGLALDLRGSAWLVAAAMAAGGWLAVRRVTGTISRRITAIDPAGGVAGNLATSALVFLASPLGFPVSTTHVSVGAIFGIGARRKNVAWRTTTGILFAWFVTLPAGAALSACFAWLAGLVR